MSPMQSLFRGLLLIVLSCIAGYRSLSVGHLSDDWAILSHVSRHGNEAAWTGPWLGMESLKFHRPLFTGLYALDYRLFGTDPWPPHAIQLAMHCIAVLLLANLIRRFGGSNVSAFLGALMFSIHPALPGATGWLAGRCGTVSGLLTLVTLSAHVERRSLETATPLQPMKSCFYAVIALVSAAGAALTRESGYLALVLPITVDWFLTARRPNLRRMLAIHAPFGAVLLGLLLLRRTALGVLGGGYPTPDGLMKGGSAILETLKEGGLSLLNLFGTIPYGYAAESVVVVIAAGAAVAAILLLGFRASSPACRRGFLVMFLLFLAQFGLLLACGPTLTPSTGQRWYAAIAFFCAMIGISATPLCTKRCLFAPILALPAFVAGHILIQNDLLVADEHAKKHLKAVLDGIRAEEVRRSTWSPKIPIGPIIASGLHASYKGLPTMHWGFSEALRPPFQDREPPSPIYPVQRWMYLGREHTYPFHPPIEALLHVLGKFPYALGAKDPWGVRNTELEQVDTHAMVTSLGDQPWKWPFFSGRVEFLEPSLPPTEEIPIQGQRIAMPIDAQAEGCSAIEFFEFMPTVAMRHRIPASNGRVITDLGPILQDYITFRGQEILVYIVAIGWPDKATTLPKLSHLLTYRYRP